MRKSLIPVLIAAIALIACSGPKQDKFNAGDDFDTVADTLTLHASLLTLSRLPIAGAAAADIRSPWDSSAFLARLLLVPRDSTLPEDLAVGRTVVRTPLTCAAVFSGVHTSALAELGALDALVAVADGSYIPAGDTVRTLIARGDVADLGPAQSPSLERLIAAAPDAVLLSPMQGERMPAVPKGAVIIPMADYLENSPIGRAEWILLLGMLFGHDSEAMAIFDRVVNDYCDLQLSAELAPGPKPLVLTDTEYSGAWYVPAGQSYMARMIADAGARTPWSDTPGTGSLTLDMERVLAGAANADFWLIRSYGSMPSLASVRAINPLNANFKAFREGAVYGCDTEKSPIFNDTAFHPERVLADLIAIFHPEAMAAGYQLRYYRKAQ
ncbi:MAG: ABC transporter substrate-binding protein [Muribaculaceae bacterium]|nr:ABC transporter substrate-binding protein [Muribaculaceae bacterium]